MTAAAVAAIAVLRRDRLSRAMRVLAAVAVVGLGVYGAGVVQLPPVETMIRDGARALGPFTYVLVGVLAFCETGGGLGVVAPGEIAVILGGVSAGQGELDLRLLIAIVWVCALAGDLVSYTMGRRLGRDFLVRHGAAVGVSEARLAQVERFYSDHGGKTIVLGRFVGLVRVLSPFIAGASRMSRRRFAAYTAVASGLWAACFSVLGYVFWQSLDELLSATREGTLVIGAVAAVVAAAIVAHRRLRPRSESA